MFIHLLTYVLCGYSEIYRYNISIQVNMTYIHTACVYNIILLSPYPGWQRLDAGEGKKEVLL